MLRAVNVNFSTCGPAAKQTSMLPLGTLAAPRRVSPTFGNDSLADVKDKEAESSAVRASALIGSAPL
jgi:hypothetical protein